MLLAGCGVGAGGFEGVGYLQMRVAVIPGKSADTVMGVVAAALQEATPSWEMVAAVVLETDQMGAWTGGSGQPGGTITLKV